MHMHHIRRGSGPPLVLVHGLGSTWRSWRLVLDRLAAEREVIALDLPGHGETPPLPSPATFARLADATAAFLEAQNLNGVAAVGSSMGARLVLELARRGTVGATVSLDPGGFWQGWERTFFHTSLAASIRLVRALQPATPALTRSAAGRAMLFAQLSAHPSRLPPDLALDEMRSFAATPSFDALLKDLAYGEEQKGAPPGATRGPVTIGWGKKDRVCLPAQAARALKRFPGAEVHWFGESGHFPQWDEPEETARLILAKTGQAKPA
jgi:pimeloyl-ACP methyl ester carboxylesterase